MDFMYFYLPVALTSINIFYPIGLGLAVGLVIETDIDEPALESQKTIIGSEIEQELRLIIGFPKG